MSVQIVMTMRLTNELHNFRNEDEPLLKYCAEVKEYIAKKKQLRKLKSYPWLEKPDDDEQKYMDEKKDEKKDEQRDRIIFEIESDEQDGKSQIYELMYVS